MKKITRRVAIEYAVDNYVTFSQKHNSFTLTPYLTRCLDELGLECTPREAFPLFTHDNASEFGALDGYDHWWPETDVMGGRHDFLLWLEEQYKDDHTEL